MHWARLALLLLTAGVAQAAAFVAGNELQSDEALDRLWQGTGRFEPILQLQIESNGAVAPSVPHPSAMDLGTQLLAMSDAARARPDWYLFNREYDYGVAQPPNCPANAPLARIVVRVSHDRGRTWSSATVIAEPDVAQGECELVDGHAFYDVPARTWHYLVQMRSGRQTPRGRPETWNINHYSASGPDPMRRFTPDARNPVVLGGQLWRGICAAAGTCPTDTADEGTPEISFKQGGYFYVSFHGAAGNPVIRGYRGAAKTADFHAWITHREDPLDARLPAGPLWSPRDCAAWSVAWYAGGCIGGGHASTLVTPRYTYLLIEAPDRSLGCTRAQHWPVGLARTPNSGPPPGAPRLASSGHWQQYPGNPLLMQAGEVPCNIQYARFFVDAGQLYLSYWTMADTDRQTFLHVARLSAPR